MSERDKRNRRAFLTVSTLAEEQATKKVANQKPLPEKMAKRLREEGMGLRAARHNN